MNYPYIEKQTLVQFIMNTIDFRMWKKSKDCECSWQMFQGKLMWIPLGGCKWHD